jgi:hypothetical protein
MKEKILVFAPIMCPMAENEISLAIKGFMLGYPHLRKMDDITELDYSKQEVKVIIITATKQKYGDGYHVNFTNTKGQIYKSVLFRSESKY